MRPPAPVSLKRGDHCADVNAMPSSARRRPRRRWSRVVMISGLALCTLTGCGATASQPSANITPGEPEPSTAAPPRSVHGPPGFARSACLPPVMSNAVCFTRPASVVLTPQSFARLVRAAGVAVRVSQIYCWPEPRPTKPGFRARTCHVIGTAGRYNILASVLSLVRSAPDSISATTRALPVSTYALPHPTPVILELVNFGVRSSHTQTAHKLQ
jgi:hypothetical protein